jgi:ATP-dependent DNA helicase RecG
LSSLFKHCISSFLCCFLLLSDLGIFCKYQILSILLTDQTELQKLETGEIALAVGTHSLTSESVKFARLGLAVIDEQHRFGVAQRGRLNSKVSKLFCVPAFSSLATRQVGQIDKELSTPWRFVQVQDSDIMGSEGSMETVMEGGNSENLAITILPSAPHVLAMSATPIPRTLALAMHGDMSISQV